MPNFKEQMTKDMDVFFNPEEFGEEHTIDGVRVVCIIDDSEAPYDDGMGGVVYRETKTISVRTSDLAKLPMTEKLIYLDAQPWTCKGVRDESGMLVITAIQGNPT